MNEGKNLPNLCRKFQLVQARNIKKSIKKCTDWNSLHKFCLHLLEFPIKKLEDFLFPHSFQFNLSRIKFLVAN